MFLEADLIQKETDNPHNNWCASGHQAPAMFRRAGPGSPEEPIRFFEVTGHGINGIYCEPCLIIAHWAAKQQKESQGKK
jgi:hypothetical protein